MQNVEHARHLRKDEHPVVALLANELSQDAVKQLHLAGRIHEDVVHSLVARGVHRPLEKVWVIAALAQLH